MKIYLNPSRDSWEDLCARPSKDNPEVRSRVAKIVERVRIGGDHAIQELSMEIEGRHIDEIRVSRQEISEAAANISEDVKTAISSAAANISAFHKAQMPQRIEVETMPGVRCVQQPVPIDNVGLYIPGGSAPLFSTVLMLAIPAQIAGCRRTILCTPAGKDGKVSPYVLYAADRCGIEEIFKIGGAQAIAAMAFGTDTIPKVDKVFGPGNQYVTAAKQMLAGYEVAVDMPAGPSEVMVMADDSSNPAFVASDLLSQAEHGPDSQVMLLCRSAAFAEKVETEVALQTVKLDRSNLVSKSLENSRTIVMADLEEMAKFANQYAPEHLIIALKDPWKAVGRIRAAGSVFVGSYTPESAGDYASGTNHTLPTCGWGRSFSGVNIDSFMRKMTIQEISRDGLGRLSRTIVSMAEAEGLAAHANAVKIRINEQ